MRPGNCVASISPSPSGAVEQLATLVGTMEPYSPGTIVLAELNAEPVCAPLPV